MEKGLADAVQHEGIKMRKRRGKPFEGLRGDAALGDPAHTVLLHAHAALEIAACRHFDEELGGVVVRRHVPILIFSVVQEYDAGHKPCIQD
jgi:hypothetical protein